MNSGKLITLKLVSRSLDGLDWEKGDFKAFTPSDLGEMESYRIGKEYECVLVKGRSGRFIALPGRAKCELDYAALMRVEEVEEERVAVAFHPLLNLWVNLWDLDRKSVRVGDYFPIAISLDEDGSLLAVTNLDSILPEEADKNYKEGQEVSLAPWRKSPLGWSCLVDDAYVGLLFHSDVRGLNMGRYQRAWIKEIREDDKMTLSLVPSGFREASNEHVTRLLSILRSEDGRITVGDKSSAEDIIEQTKMSKRAFKMACGILYKEGLVELFPRGVRLKDKEE
jgi:predicted RNA-binding protein (virulence factor B family)